MSARLPALISNVNSERNSTRPKAPLTVSNPSFLPKIESPKKDPGSVWQRVHSKVDVIVLPKVFIDARQLAEEEAEHRRALDSLPQLSADFVQKVDFFAKYLDENQVASEGMSDFNKFMRFCQLHGSFEKKQRLYYALIARRAVKLRQIQAVQDEMRGYKAAATVLDELAAKNETKKLSESKLISEFHQMINEYANKSFVLASLKSREEHVGTKFRLLKAKADRMTEKDERKYLEEKTQILRSHIAVLDATIYQSVYGLPVE